MRNHIRKLNLKNSLKVSDTFTRENNLARIHEKPPLTEGVQAWPMGEPKFKSITRRFPEIPFRYSFLMPIRNQTTGQ